MNQFKNAEELLKKLVEAEKQLGDIASDIEDTKNAKGRNPFPLRARELMQQAYEDLDCSIGALKDALKLIDEIKK